MQDQKRNLRMQDQKRNLQEKESQLAGRPSRYASANPAVNASSPGDLSSKAQLLPPSPPLKRQPPLPNPRARERLTERRPKALGKMAERSGTKASDPVTSSITTPQVVDGVTNTYFRMLPSQRQRRRRYNVRLHWVLQMPHLWLCTIPGNFQSQRNPAGW